MEDIDKVMSTRYIVRQALISGFTTAASYMGTLLAIGYLVDRYNKSKVQETALP